MKTYIIKYEDHSGQCHIETYKTHDKESAKSLLKHPAKEIYWIKEHSSNQRLLT